MRGVRRTIAAAAIGLAAGVLLAAAPAEAGTPRMTYCDVGDDGLYYEEWKDSNDKTVIWVLLKDGTWMIIDHESIGAGNPNPDDASSGPKDTAALFALLKNIGTTELEPPDFWATDVGRQLCEAGHGPAGVWNPGVEAGGDSGDDGGYVDVDKVTQKVKGYGQSLEGSGFHEDADDFSTQLKDGLKKGGNSSGDDGDDDGGSSPPPISGERLPGPPELVNPQV